MKTYYTYDTAIGKVGLCEEDGSLCGVRFGGYAENSKAETPLLREAIAQLTDYLSGKRKMFDIPLSPQGTDFEKSVWDALLQIPYGEKTTYGEIAKKLERPNAARAVGRACALNPVALFIPCHRVVGASGKLTGFAGGLPIKEQLLQLEGAL